MPAGACMLFTGCEALLWRLNGLYHFILMTAQLSLFTDEETEA